MARVTGLCVLCAGSLLSERKRQIGLTRHGQQGVACRMCGNPTMWKERKGQSPYSRLGGRGALAKAIEEMPVEIMNEDGDVVAPDALPEEP